MQWLVGVEGANQGFATLLHGWRAHVVRVNHWLAISRFAARVGALRQKLLLRRWRRFCLFVTDVLVRWRRIKRERQRTPPVDFVYDT